MNTVPAARAWLKANPPAKEAAKVRLLDGDRPMVCAWHEAYAAAAEELAEDFTMGGVNGLLHDVDAQAREIAASRAHSVLNATGDVVCELAAMRFLPARDVLRGTARLFLFGDSYGQEVKEWLLEMARWERAWVEGVFGAAREAPN